MSIQRSISTILLLLVAACSSGGGISGTGNMSSGFALGPIDGFGSVIVNGVRFDTSSATFTAEGMPATQADLAVGQVVEVQGDFATGIATRCPFATRRSNSAIISAFVARAANPDRLCWHAPSQWW